MKVASPWLSLAALLIGISVLMGVADLGGGALNELLLHLPGVDKVLHVLLGLALFLAIDRILRATGASATKSAVVAVAGAALVAVLDEAQQRFVGERSVEAADIAAALAGVVIGLAWLQAAGRPRVAVVLGACGLVAGAWLTVTSHLQTRDYNRGILAERAGRPDDALNYYRAAVARGVRNPEAYNALAWMMLEHDHGDPREAVGHAERSLLLRPDNPDALDTYGWALFRAGEAAAAVRPLEQALAAKPGIYCIHYHLGMAYLETGRPAEGIAHLRQQITLRPQSAEAVLAAAVLARVDGGARQ